MAGKQKRHWIHTIHPAHLGIDGNEAGFEAEFERLWESLEQDSRLRYACAQAERGEEGALHFQVYTEWKTSLRLAQVCKALPSHAESREGTRTQARNYCRKADSRVFALHDLGEWRSERGDDDYGQVEGPKARALRYLTGEGLTPLEVAARDPECYFTFSNPIHTLWNALRAMEAQPPPPGTQADLVREEEE